MKQVLSIAKFAHASKYGIKSYKVLRALNKIAGTQVHHLIEQRFAGLLGIAEKDMLSIVLTESEHQIFTNAWREAIPYATQTAVGLTTKTATVVDIERAARSIYKDYPDILKP